VGGDGIEGSFNKNLNKNKGGNRGEDELRKEKETKRFAVKKSSGVASVCDLVTLTRKRRG
jgi:hypothetical protein